MRINTFCNSNVSSGDACSINICNFPTQICIQQNMSHTLDNYILQFEKIKCYNLNVLNGVSCTIAICKCGFSAVLVHLQPVQYAAPLLGFEMCQVELSADILNTKEILAYNCIIHMFIWILDTAACALCNVHTVLSIPKYFILHSYIGTYRSHKYANEVYWKLLRFIWHLCNKR